MSLRQGDWLHGGQARSTSLQRSHHPDPVRCTGSAVDNPGRIYDSQKTAQRMGYRIVNDAHGGY